MSTKSLADVKSHFSAVVDEVASTHERVVVTRKGQPAAILVAVDDLESLEETVAVLSDSAALADIREADAAYRSGDVLMGVAAVRDLRP